MDGSFWYHPHHHFCECIHRNLLRSWQPADSLWFVVWAGTELHVEAGAVGAMILENPDNGAPDDAIQRFTQNDRLLYMVEFDHDNDSEDAIDGWTANGSPLVQDIDLLDGEW